MATTRRKPKHNRAKAKARPKVGPGTSRRHNPVHQTPGNSDELAPPSNLPPAQDATPPGGGGSGQPENEIVPGLPPDIQARVDAIFRKWGDNVDAAQHEAIAYLMTTPWFAQNYAGYSTGFSNGRFSDPFSGGLAQYRSYKQETQRIYKQYYGRDVSNDDLVSLLNANFDTQRIEQMGQGFSIQQANQGDWQYYSGNFGGQQLTDFEKRAYAEEQAGIDSPLGLRIKQKVEQAIQRYQGVFGGQLGSSGLADQQLSQRISKPKDIQA